MNVITTVARIWPSLRIVLYTGMSALFGGLTIFDIMSEEQSASLLGGLDTALGAAAFLLAAFYTPGGAKVPAPTVIVNPTVPAPVPADLPAPAGVTVRDVTEAIERFDDVAKATGVTAGRLRARLEQRLGNR